MSWNDGPNMPFGKHPNDAQSYSGNDADNRMPSLPSMRNGDHDGRSYESENNWGNAEPFGEWPKQQREQPAASMSEQPYLHTAPFQAQAPATQQFGAPPAALPGDEYPSSYGPPSGPSDTDYLDFAPQQDKRKPLFKRPAFIIGVSAAVVLVAAAAVGIPWYIHTQNVQRGDDLAAQFEKELDEYNKTWNEENLAAITAPSLSSILSGTSEAFFDLSESDLNEFTSMCGELQAATDTRQELADADVPELPGDEGATASEDYLTAQQQAEHLSGTRENADTFLANSETYLNAMQQLCDRLPAYAEIQQNFETDLETTLPDAYVVPNGGETKTSDGSIYFPCQSENGCPDLYNADNREKFAQAYESTYVEYFRDLAEQSKNNCFFDDFQSVCDVAATEFQKASDANKKIVDHLRNTEPTVEVGKSLYPDLSGLVTEASTAEQDASTKVVAAWSEVEAGVSVSIARTGPSLATYLDDLKAKADEVTQKIIG